MSVSKGYTRSIWPLAYITLRGNSLIEKAALRCDVSVTRAAPSCAAFGSIVRQAGADTADVGVGLFSLVTSVLQLKMSIHIKPGNYRPLKTPTTRIYRPGAHPH